MQSLLLSAAFLIGCLLGGASLGASLADSRFVALQYALSDKVRVARQFSADFSAWGDGSLDGCRYPLTWQYFSSRFPGQHGEACQQAVPFMVQQQRIGIRPQWVDPERVREIHFVFAGNGGSSISRFGHVALRLVICPQRDSTDEQCALNVQEHVILGFMAHVDTFRIDAIKGLSGKYHARLLATKFLDAYRDYAISEFRDLYSVPLRLNERQREDFVRGLAQIHWQYQGDYTFFGKNCASLLQRALRALLPEYVENPALRVDRVRPDKLFEAMKRSGFLEIEKLENRETAERSGYLFSSGREYYVRAFRELKKRMPGVSSVDLEDYLRLQPEQRKGVILSDENRVSLQSDAHLAEAALILEELSLVRDERAFSSGFALMLDRAGLDKDPERLRRRLDERQRLVFDQCLWRPATALLDSRLHQAGIPDAADVPERVDAGIPSECLGVEDSRLLRDIFSLINDGQDENWKDISYSARRWWETLQVVFQLRDLHVSSGT